MIDRNPALRKAFTAANLAERLAHEAMTQHDRRDVDAAITRRAQQSQAWSSAAQAWAAIAAAAPRRPENRMGLIEYLRGRSDVQAIRLNVIGAWTFAKVNAGLYQDWGARFLARLAAGFLLFMPFPAIFLAIVEAHGPDWPPYRFRGDAVTACIVAGVIAFFFRFRAGYEEYCTQTPMTLDDDDDIH